MNQHTSAGQTREGEIKAEPGRATAVSFVDGAAGGRVLILGLTLLLTAIGIAVMPCWRYSASWGYGPGIGVGILLVSVGTFAAAGQTGSSDALTERHATRPQTAIVIEASVVEPALPPDALPGISGSSPVVWAE